MGFSPGSHRERNALRESKILTVTLDWEDIRNLASKGESCPSEPKTDNAYQAASLRIPTIAIHPRINRNCLKTGLLPRYHYTLSPKGEREFTEFAAPAIHLQKRPERGRPGRKLLRGFPLTRE